MTNRSPYSGFYVVDAKRCYVSGPHETLAKALTVADVLTEDVGQTFTVGDPEAVVDMPDLEHNDQAAWDRDEDAVYGDS